MYRLWFQNGVAAQEPPVVDASLFTIGRDATCQLRLYEEGVSDCHARIERRADGYYVRDLGSTHGVSVNGQPVAESRLATGDELEIGSARMRFEVVHNQPGGRQHRPLDLLQFAATVIVILVIGGEIALLGEIFAEQRSKKMNVDVKRGWRGQQAVIGAEPTPTAPPPTGDALPPVPPKTGTSASVPTVLHRMIRIVRVDRSDAGNMVTLTILAKAQVGERELDAAAVALCVQFASFEGGTANVVWRDPMWLSIPAWDNFASKTFTVRFQSTPRELAGFVVRSYYRNEVQDIAATPPSLRALAPLPEPGTPPNPVYGGAS